MIGIAHDKSTQLPTKGTFIKIFNTFNYRYKF